MADDSNQNLWVRIVDGLQQNPAYLLVFGVCALFFLSALATTAKGIINTDNISLVIGLASFVIALGGVVFVVRQVESNELSRLKNENVKLQQEKSQTNFPNQFRETMAQYTNKSDMLIEDFEAILDSLIQAVQYEHQTFTEIMLERSTNWRSIAADWKNGQYFASDDYNDVLAVCRRG